MTKMPSRSDLGPLPEDDLDILLRSFYHAEMPQPWPQFKAPARRVRLAPAQAESGLSARFRSLLALAVSAAVIGFGVWWLDSSNPTQTAASVSPVSSTNSGSAERNSFTVPRTTLPNDGGDRPQIDSILVDPATGTRSFEFKLPLEAKPDR